MHFLVAKHGTWNENMLYIALCPPLLRVYYTLILRVIDVRAIPTIFCSFRRVASHVRTLSVPELRDGLYRGEVATSWFTAGVCAVRSLTGNDCLRYVDGSLMLLCVGITGECDFIAEVSLRAWIIRRAPSCLSCLFTIRRSVRRISDLSINWKK